MEQNEFYYKVRKKHCQIEMAGHTNEYIDKGNLFIAIEYRFFNSGAIDIHALRAARGIEIHGSGKRYNISKIYKSRKHIFLFLENPELLLEF
jgi:hypothetical protein